ncbi:response regulator transcription factor [Tunicatimonas pelagia]|uniref:response regulator transcription factor n=1 Tax=Tunicatimonas pelagia TaxID=931531 RepID=UPI002666832A|nr:response regulator transcription factor [Tunicatimonas pelagia]WKN43180.1 response regulator transcription factor [Tunicatimonas pelagia]
MKKILIVEDEPSMRMGLGDNLEFEGYEVATSSDGQEGLQRILNESFDLVILDVMLPSMSGFEICKATRKKGNNTPIILLTAKGEEIDKVRGLELGADDYITKPFSLRELLARIKAVLRRQPTASVPPSLSAKSNIIELGRLKIFLDAYEAFSDDEPVKMSHKEFEIIRYLWDHARQPVSRYDLLENIWGYEDDQPTTRTVDNFIVKLRQKIETNPNDPRHILTIHGVGYKLIP